MYRKTKTCTQLVFWLVTQVIGWSLLNIGAKIESNMKQKATPDFDIRNLGLLFKTMSFHNVRQRFELPATGQ